MSDRFDLEQQLIECWKVTDDINLVYASVMDTNMSQDDIANVLLGLKTLYDLKFNRLWNTFETCIHNRDI